jgi:hypothetical protein
MCSDQRELDKKAKKEVFEKIAEIFWSYNKIPKTTVNYIEEKLTTGEKVVVARFPVKDFFTFVWLDEIINRDNPYYDEPLEMLYDFFTYCHECDAWFANRFIRGIKRDDTIKVYCPEGHLIKRLKEKK